MHFSIPTTKEVFCNNTGSCFTVYNIHINGCFHCCLRYKQIHALNDQLKKIFPGFNLSFPSKQLLPLTPTQLEQRRSKLERYIQLIGQDSIVARSDFLLKFLLNAQKETAAIESQEKEIEIFLLNGFRIALNVYTTDSSLDVLKKSCQVINIPNEFINYFCLYLIKKNDNGDIALIRKLDDFESPYITQMFLSDCEIVIRKSYWDQIYDTTLIKNNITLNLLYIQTVSDVEKNWIATTNSEKEELALLQVKGKKKEYLEISKALPLYGCLLFNNVKSDYPEPNTISNVSIGNREITMRSSKGNILQETKFKVIRMKCWRVTTIHLNTDNTDSDPLKENDKYTFKLSFEYLITKNTLKWITLVSDQAMLLSVSLQSIVDELLNQKTEKQLIENEARLRTTESNIGKSSTNYKLKDKCNTSVSFRVDKESVRNHAFEVIGDDDL